MNKYDCIIIGAGAAGLTAAIYTSRRKLKTLVLTIDIGGQAAIATDIENYPGSTEKDGYKLMKKFAEQAKSFGAKIKFEKVKKIDKIDKKITIETEKDRYEAGAVILAYGKTPRKLKVKGEDKFSGKGIAYCATCDAPLFQNKVVGVVGGGNSALEAAILLSKIAEKVYLIHRRDEFRGEKYLVDRVISDKKIEILYNSEVKEVGGKEVLDNVIIENNQTKKKNKLKIQGLFVEIGYEVNPKPVEHLVKLDEYNQVIVDGCGRTSNPGIFAAGDLTITPYKQIVISAGEGAKAALCAYEYLHGDRTNTNYSTNRY